MRQELPIWVKSRLTPALDGTPGFYYWAVF